MVSKCSANATYYSLYNFCKYYCKYYCSNFPYKKCRIYWGKKNRANHKLIPSVPQKSLCTLISFTQLLFWVVVQKESSKPQKSTFENYWINVAMSPCIIIIKPILIYTRVIYVPSVVGFVLSFFFSPLNSQWNQKTAVFWRTVPL